MSDRGLALLSSVAAARPPITRRGARADARHELAKPIYHRGDQSLILRILKAIGRLVDRLLNHASGPDINGFGWLSVTLVVGILAVVVFLVVRRVGVPRRTGEAGAVLIGGQIATAAEHRSLAEEAATRGDWSTAVLERMRAIARELEERGVLDPRPGRTASELAREASAELPDSAIALRAAAEMFNAVTYGGRPATPRSLEPLAAADDAVRRGRRVEAMA